MSIDFKGLEEYLEVRASKKKFIYGSDHIDKDDLAFILKLLKKYGRSEVAMCISSTSRDGFSRNISIEIFCSCCNKYKFEYISKTAFVRFLKCGVYVCAECQREFEEDTKVIEEEEKQDATKEYISEFLSTNQKWNDIKYYRKIEILESYNIDIKKVASYIKSMKYKDFLKTLYWKAIAETKKARAKNSCQLCGGKESLAVHHKTYENHGYELYNMGDLIVLCKNCHSKFHDKVED